MHFNVFKHLRDLQTLVNVAKCLIEDAALWGRGLVCGLSRIHWNATDWVRSGITAIADNKVPLGLTTPKQ
jgi:hypothetical protein